MTILYSRFMSYVYIFFVAGTLILFFGFHTIAGDRGLLARDGIERAIQAAKEDLSLIERENHFLEQRINLLKTGAIDADLLAETVRAELGLYDKKNVIISIDMKKIKF